MSYVGRGRARNVINLAARYLRLSPPRTPEKPGGKKVVAIPIPGSLVPEPIHDTVVSEFVPPTFIPNKYDTVVDIDLQRSLDAAFADTVPAAFICNYNAPVKESHETPPQSKYGKVIRIDGRVFIVGKLIARGGEGEVYRGLQLIEGQESKKVVMKFSHRPGVDMRKEAEVTAKVGNGKNQYIVRYVAHNDECLVLEYVDSRTLDEHIRSEGRVPLDRTLAIARSTCRALEHAAATGFPHRDLKPGNIMFDPETGAVKLFDFGIAARYAASLQEGKTMGSLHYCDPGQLAGNQRGDLSDQYSLGLIVSKMLMGQDPISMRSATDQTPPGAESLAARYYRLHTSMELQPDPNVPPALLPILRRMTAKDEEQRYPNWLQVKIAFAQASRSLGIQLA